MIKILIVTGWLDVSGTETFIMNVLRAIDKTRFHVDFLLFNHKDSAYSKEAEYMGCVLNYLPARSQGLFNYLKSLNRFFAEKHSQYDVVHYCGGSLTAIAPMFFAKKYGINTIIAHAHSTANEGLHNIILHKINRLLINKIVTHRWGCSKEACRYFFGKHQANIVRNGVDLNYFRFDLQARAKERNAFGIDNDALVLGHIGRFVPLKNQNFVVDVFAELHKIKPNSFLMLVGIGPEIDKIHQKVEKLQLLDSVIFTKERHDIPQLLWCMDCLLMPSIYEGLPFVLVEAQASDLNCIASDTISLDSKISDGLCFMSLTESARQWANQILKITEDRLRRNFHDDVKRNGFDINDTVVFIEKTYLSSQNK